MLNTMFQGHQSISSREEDFLKFFSIYGHGSHLGNVTQLIYTEFHSHSPISFHMNFGSKSPNCFCNKTSFNFEISLTFEQGQRMTLTFDTHSTSLTHELTASSNSETKDCNSFQK